MESGLYDLVLSLPVVLLSLTVHEYAHALAADRLGDSTARLAGRVSLEPWVHLDLIGFLVLVFYGFGWAKPVPVNPLHMRRPRSGFVLTALAGPLANLVLGFALALLLGLGALGLAGPGLRPHLERMVAQGVVINATLALFNLLPLPPLDGSRLLAWALPLERWSGWAWLDQYGPLLLVVIMVSGLGSLVIAGPVQGLTGLMAAAARGLAGLFGLQ